MGTRLIDSKHDVADQVFVEVGVACAQFVDQPDHQVQWFDLVQRAVALLAARRADRLVDEGFFGHVLTLQGLGEYGYADPKLKKPTRRF